MGKSDVFKNGEVLEDMKSEGFTVGIPPITEGIEEYNQRVREEIEELCESEVILITKDTKLDTYSVWTKGNGIIIDYDEERDVYQCTSKSNMISLKDNIKMTMRHEDNEIIFIKENEVTNILL